MNKRSIKQLVFPIIVGVLSLSNIFRNFQDFYLTSFLVSVIGLGGVVLFLLNNKKASILFYVWIISQIITFSNVGFTYYTEQSPNISLGMNFQGKNSIFSINFLPLFYFIGYRLIKMYDLIGQNVSIRPIKAESNLKPIKGTISEIINLNKDGKWFKVDYLENKNSEVKSVIIKPKGEERFSKKSSIFAFVKESDGNRSFIDWGKVKLIK
jgi:hypothetical protein